MTFRVGAARRGIFFFWLASCTRRWHGRRVYMEARACNVPFVFSLFFFLPLARESGERREVNMAFRDEN